MKHNAFSSTECVSISSQQRFSRRAMLGGLAVAAGVGMASCGLPSGQAQTPISAPPTATSTVSPTPTPSPVLTHQLGTTLYTYRGHASRVNAVAWAPDGQRVASGSQLDSTVQVWDALTGANVVTHRVYEDSGATVTWAPDGKRIASGDSKVHFGLDFVDIWDASSGQSIKTFQAHTRSPAPGPVNGLSWSPDGKYLAAANQDYTVRVWEIATGNIHFFYSDPHGYLMNCIA